MCNLENGYKGTLFQTVSDHVFKAGAEIINDSAQIFCDEFNEAVHNLKPVSCKSLAVVIFNKSIFNLIPYIYMRGSERKCHVEKFRGKMFAF